LQAENVAKKMKELIKVGPQVYPARNNMMANGEEPARLSAVKSISSTALTLIPAKKAIPQ